MTRPSGRGTLAVGVALLMSVLLALGTVPERADAGDRTGRRIGW